MFLFALLLCAGTSAQPELNAELNWIDAKGDTTRLDWRWTARWVWKKSSHGPAPEIPVLRLEVEYPAQFPLLGAADPTVKFQPGRHTFVLEEREPLFTKTLYYRGEDGKRETGGLAITFRFDEPSYLLHPTCVRQNLELGPAGGSPTLFYVGFYCKPQSRFLEVTLLHSGDVVWPGTEFLAQGKGWKRLTLPKHGEAKQVHLGTRFGPEEGASELSLATAPFGRPESTGLRLSAALSPTFLSFEGDGGSFNEISVLAKLAAEIGIAPGWELKADVSATPAALVSRSPTGLFQASLSLKEPIRSSAFSFEAGPLVFVSSLPLSVRKTHFCLGPQLRIAADWGKDRAYRFWAEGAVLGVDSAVPDFSNPRLGLGLSLPLFSGPYRDWFLSTSLTNTELGAADARGHLSAFAIDIQTSL